MIETVAPNTLIEDLRSFVRWRHEHLAGDEKREAQVFLDRLFGLSAMLA